MRVTGRFVQDAFVKLLGQSPLVPELLPPCSVYRWDGYQITRARYGSRAAFGATNLIPQIVHYRGSEIDHFILRKFGGPSISSKWDKVD